MSIFNAEEKLMGIIEQYSKSNLSNREAKETIRNVLSTFEKSRSRSASKMRTSLNEDLVDVTRPEISERNLTPNSSTWNKIHESFNSESWRKSPSKQRTDSERLNKTVGDNSRSVSRQSKKIKFKHPFLSKDHIKIFKNFVDSLKTKSLKIKSKKSKKVKNIEKHTRNEHASNFTPLKSNPAHTYDLY